jgi:hypothetical protein
MCSDNSNSAIHDKAVVLQIIRSFQGCPSEETFVTPEMHQQSVMRGNIVPAPIPPDSPKEKDKEETSMN